MKVFVAFAALLQLALSGHVSVRMPYLNPAGVTYINSVPQDAQYTYAQQAALQQPAYQYAQYGQYAQYAAPLQYAAAVPAKVETHHVGYAAAQVPAVAAVPYVKHIPTVSHVPVTRYEAQPALIEKQVDVVKPAVSTRKVEVRRPAIQKQFYDIEERVIVRPAGSAVVELEEPNSKQQKGPAVIQSLAHGAHLQYQPYQLQGVHAVAPVYQQASFAHPTSGPLFTPSSTPAPAQASSEDESVVVDNADFRNAAQAQQQQQAGYQQQQQAGYQQQQAEYQQQQQQQAEYQRQIQQQSNNAPLSPNGRLAAHDPSPSLIASQRNSAEENKYNQNKLIELLTARGGVTELGVGHDGVSVSSVGDAGQVRARVLSATPAPEYSEPQERVSTRRVVVSRPIETLQEVDVVEPASKIERVAYQQPTFIKTARVEHVPVHGSVQVVGKALAPAVAHAAVPVYQKTISPAYQYYH